MCFPNRVGKKESILENKVFALVGQRSDGIHRVINLDFPISIQYFPIPHLKSFSRN